MTKRTTSSVSWVKRFDVLLAGKERLAVVRKILVDVQRDIKNGKIDLSDDRSGRRFVWTHVFEYFDTCRALAWGGRNGTIKTELGLNMNHAGEPRDFELLVEHMIDYQKVFTFRRLH